MTGFGSGRVAVLIPTFRRSESLEALLRILDTAVMQLATEHWQVVVFVVDNDAELHAGANKAQALAGQLSIEIRTLIEATTGVSRVRNRLVRAALEWQADYLLMIDDDEWPSDGWMRQMLDTALAHDADIVSGPVRPDYATSPPAWIERYRLFDDEPLPTGSFPAVQRTGNILLRSEVLRNSQWFPEKEWFSVELGRYGGEDSHLIERLVHLGARHVWCEEAVVHERIPQSRLNFDYLAARAFRCGNCGMMYRSLLLPGFGWQCVRVGKSVFLALRWLALSYRLLDSNTSKRHWLDWHTVRGRFSAHAGRFQRFY